ncbi:MAG TPA: hypothetical protein VM388_09315 [Acidimicrobiales bacterium]|jgi:hypothetical protein|nr:hypothetical protein [Acidimicrobiales bacterium]HWI04530.1 hypothetical protein [Acidimicrobiales bacterium]
MAAVAPFELTTRSRHLAIDERGIGLRATWRLEQGFVNLSLWRHDVCVETFRLTPAEASGLVAFLVEGLARAVPPAAVVAPAPPAGGYRLRLAEALEAMATKLRH